MTKFGTLDDDSLMWAAQSANIIVVVVVVKVVVGSRERSLGSGALKVLAKRGFWSVGPVGPAALLTLLHNRRATMIEKRMKK